MPKTTHRTCYRWPCLFVYSLQCLIAIAFAFPVAALDHDRAPGEPYQLAGKRLVFTTWYFVRPGQPDWHDPSTSGEYPGGTHVQAFDAGFSYFEHPFGIRLAAEPAQRSDPIIARERPWETMGLAINTIIADNGAYRAWGNCQDADGKGNNCYFESSDGQHWTRPNLGLIEYQGSRENNLIGYQALSVFIDPIAPPEQRYKSVKHSHFRSEDLEKIKQTRPHSVMSTETGSGWMGDCIVGAYSADGLNWTELPDPITVEPSDTQVVAYYDTQLKKYVLFTRSHMIGPRAEGEAIATDRRHLYVSRRAIGRTESENFQRFPLSQTIIEPESDRPPTDTYYTNCYTTIPGAPDLHLMFPAIYQQDQDTTTTELFASNDSKLWHRVPGTPVLSTNTFGKWDGGCVFTRPNLVELPGGSWAIPYTGYLYPHKYPRGGWAYDAGLAIWPKGRLISLQAKDHGEFTTVAFLAPGSKLRINAVTERAGQILIEAADLEGKPIAGRTFSDAIPIVGDRYQSAITWKSADDLGVKVGKPVVLRFRMDMAKIYSLDFE